jgi:hypothetical protein
MYYAEWLEATTEEKYVVNATEKFVSLEECVELVKSLDAKNHLEEIDFLEIDSHNNHIIILSVAGKFREKKKYKNFSIVSLAEALNYK